MEHQRLGIGQPTVQLRLAVTRTQLEYFHSAAVDAEPGAPVLHRERQPAILAAADPPVRVRLRSELQCVRDAIAQCQRGARIPSFSSTSCCRAGTPSVRWSIRTS